MVQQDTMQMLGFTVTDEKIGDSPAVRAPDNTGTEE